MAVYDSKYNGAELDDAIDDALSHIQDKSNPHNVTKSQVGLGNVDNTADEDKDVAHAENADKALNIFGSTQTNDIFVYRPTAGIQDIQSGEPGLGGAEVQKIEGNGMAWNQLIKMPTSSQPNGWVNLQNPTYNADGSFTVTPINDWEGGQYYIESVVGHKCFCSLDIKGFMRVFFGGEYIVYMSSGETFAEKTAIKTIITSDEYTLLFSLWGAANTPATLWNIQVIDLTLLFGEGNEPSTVAEFETWLSNNIGLKDYYPYNACELIGVKTISVKTTGFNQLNILGRTEYATTYLNPDEKLDSLSESILIKGYSADGYIRDSLVNSYSVSGGSITVKTGDHLAAPSYGIGFPVKVLPNTSYYLTSNAPADSQISVTFIDEEGYLINYLNTEGYGTFTSPAGAYWCIITFKPAAFDSEKTWTDINLNLHHSGDRDGEYEPYWSETKQIPITTITGKLNGQGNSVTVFPDGMKSVGSVRDEIKVEGNVVKAIKRIGSVDLGSLSWYLADQNRFYSPSIANYLPLYDSSVKANVICAIMCTVTDSSLHWNTDIEGIAVGADKYIYIRKSSFSGKTGTEVKSELSGVILFYELATPEEYVLDNFTMPLDYSVDDWGTEELLLGNTSSIVSCAPKMSIKYGINAADAIKNLPHNYVSVKQQTLSSTEKVQARQNIGACAEDDSRLSDARVASNMIADYTEVSSNTSGVTTSLTQDGSETKVYYNSGNAAVTVSFATSGLVFTDGNDSMEIPAVGYGEVNFLRVTTGNTTRVFVRSIVSE